MLSLPHLIFFELWSISSDDTPEAHYSTVYTLLCVGMTTGAGSEPLMGRDRPNDRD